MGKSRVLAGLQNFIETLSARDFLYPPNVNPQEKKKMLIHINFCSDFRPAEAKTVFCARNASWSKVTNIFVLSTFRACFAPQKTFFGVLSSDLQLFHQIVCCFGGFWNALLLPEKNS